MVNVSKIVSGGQTGADRAALDYAIEHGISHGGWCPAGRKAEDGAICDRYTLQETSSANYLVRTEWNVRDSDGTLILTIRPSLSGGSKRTADLASKHLKPCLHLHAGDSVERGAARLGEFLALNRISVINIAGSRASKEPEVGAFVRAVLSAAGIAPTTSVSYPMTEEKFGTHPDWEDEQPPPYSA